MAKRGYPCPHCGYIHYQSLCPWRCNQCGEAFHLDNATSYEEPAPEYDPQVLERIKISASAQQEAEKEPVQEEQPVQKNEPADDVNNNQEKYCPHCGDTVPYKERRCPKCGGILFVRPKTQGPVKREQFRLRITGQGVQCEIVASAEEKSFGRSSAPGLPKVVSRDHFHYYVKDGVLMIVDHSTNGTFIDNIQINKDVPHAVKSLDKGFFQLGLGHHVVLKVELCD